MKNINRWLALGGAVAAYFLFLRPRESAAEKVVRHEAESEAQGLTPINPDVVAIATEAQLAALKALQSTGTVSPEQARVLTEDLVRDSGILPPSPGTSVTPEWRPGVAPRTGTMPL